MSSRMAVAVVSFVLGAVGVEAMGQCALRWSPVPDQPTGSVYTLTTHDFDGAGPEPARLIVVGRESWLGLGCSIRSFDGATWGQVGAMFDAPPKALVSLDPDGSGPAGPVLFAGGGFTTTDGSPANYVAQWNGSAWVGVGGAVTGAVYAMCSFDVDGPGPGAPALIVETAEGKVLSWNGSSWTAIGQVQPAGIRASLAAFDDDGARPRLYVGGAFTSVSGVAAVGIASWDGAAWSPVGGGLTSSCGGRRDITCMAVHDDDGPGPRPPALYVGGGLGGAGGLSSPGVARWDGHAWSALPAASCNLSTLCSFDPDGAGGLPPLLVGGGEIQFAGRQGIMMYDGVSWSLPDSGVRDVVNTVATFDADGPGGEPPRLYAGGDFTDPGRLGLGVGKLARFGCMCPADVNRDGVVDFPDWLAFLNAYVAKSPLADLSGDGVVDFGDYLEFLNVFEAGC